MLSCVIIFNSCSSHSCRCSYSTYSLSLCFCCGNNLLSLYFSFSKQFISISRDISSPFRNYNCFINSFSRCRFVLKDWTCIKVCSLDYLGNSLFPLNSHNVHTGDTFNLSALVNYVNTDVDTFLLLVSGTLHPLNDVIRYFNSRHKFLHIPGHSYRFRRSNTC